MVTLGKVETRFVRLARQQYDAALARAEQEWAEAVTLLAQERGVPAGTPVRVQVTDDAVHLVWDSAGDINPLPGHCGPDGVTDA